MPDGVLVFDQSEKLVYANAAALKIFSVRGENIAEKRFLEIARVSQLDDLLQQVRKSGEAGELEVKAFLPEEKDLLAEASLISPDKLVLVVRDVTAMKRLENLRRDFVANVSHELKTPLTAIRGYVETLLAGAVDDRENNRLFLQKILLNTDNLATLIEDILEISSLEARRKDVPFIKIDLTALVDRAIETVSAKAKAKKITLIKLADHPSCSITGDPEHLTRALINLLDNAVNYSDQGGKVELFCEKAGDLLRLNVRDHGIGIDQQHLERIFERFYRIDKARSRDQGGTGLGLSIVKHIMEFHNGSVAVQSQLGQGSTFTLIFPAA